MTLVWWNEHRFDMFDWWTEASRLIKVKKKKDVHICHFEYVIRKKKTIFVNNYF